MKTKAIALLAATALCAAALVGCGAVRDKDPVTEYDAQTVFEEDLGPVLIKQKTFEYEGCGVELLHVTNKSDRTLSVTVYGKFIGSGARRFGSSEKTLAGLRSGASAYLLLEPGIRYDSCQLFVFEDEYEGEPPRDYLHPGTGLDLYAAPAYDLFRGHGDDDVILAHMCIFDFVKNTDRDIMFSARFIALDDRGEIFHIFSSSGNLIGRSRHEGRMILYSDVLWSDDYELPENLRGELHGIVSIEDAEWYMGDSPLSPYLDEYGETEQGQ